MPDIPEGVSSINNEGGRQAIESSSVRKTRRQPQRDVIDVSKGRRVDPNLPPVGTMRNRVDIVEMPIENSRTDRFVASYASCDGTMYSFRTHNNKGEPDPRRESLCLFLAMREISLGGTPAPVFEAFKLKIDDMDGRQVYPIVSAEPEVVDSSFTLGE